MDPNNEVAFPKTIPQYLRIILSGFAMGSVEIVPGVSGGTMAFILGIYETLIDSIKSFNLGALRLALKFDFKALFEQIPIRFLLALGLGMGTAIFTLARLLRNLIETQPTLIFAFFGGLIIASVIAIILKVKWGVAPLIALILGALFAFFVAGVSPLQDAGHGPIILIISGAIAVMALILPGISGSFMLLILGQYAYVLNAVSEFDFTTIGFVAIGAVIGILGFSRIVSYLLKHYEAVTIATLVGFIIGSLRVIWNEALWIHSEETDELVAMRELEPSQILFALGALIVGFIIVTVLDHIQSGNNLILRSFWKIERADTSKEEIIAEKL